MFESTVYPGVTEDICGPAIAAASGCRAGVDFLLGYSPERINPGDRTHTVDRIAKVVAGQTPEVAQRLAALYGKVTSGGIHVAPNIRTAEAAKVIENAQRDLNIAFINEVTMIFGRLGLSIYDVLDAARTKWNFLDFRPAWSAATASASIPTTSPPAPRPPATSPRSSWPAAASTTAWATTSPPASPSTARAAKPRTLVLGLTFKENLPDLRNSKVVDLIHGLQARGHAVDVHDPHADAAEAKSAYGLVAPPRAAERRRLRLPGRRRPPRRLSRVQLRRRREARRPGRRHQGNVARHALPEGLRRWQP